MDLSTAPRGELIALIYELSDKVQILEAEIARLKEQLHQKGKPGLSNKLPDFVKPNVKKKPLQPRKNRSTSYTRKKETPTEKIFHSASVCPDCGGTLGKPTVAYTRQIIDIPITSYIVTEHIICKRWCVRCKKRIMPEINLDQYAVGKGRIGIKLVSAIATMRERLRLPIGVIQTYLRLFYGLKLSKGEIIKLLQLVAGKGKPVYEGLLEELKRAPVVHGDETGGRENGINGYFWSLNTDQIHYLFYRKSRGKQVVEEFVGENGDEYEGILVSDFYAAYNTYSGFHQRCWVHLLRDIKTLVEQFPHDKELKRWAAKIHTIYEEAKTYQGPNPTLPLGTKQQERIKKQWEFEQKLKNICQPYLTQDVPMSTLCGRMINFLPELFVFVRFPNVPSDNNSAERILRHTVTARKISGGTRSSRGSETKSILASLFGTWHLRGLNPLTQCQLLLTSC
jgi:hypothetical protein